MIVEDQTEIRGLLQLVLERDGWHVGTARNGIEAIANMDTTLPAVILLDLEMPGLDGWGVLARRAVEPTWKRVPVIAMSADHRHAWTVIELGANWFLHKPFTMDDLRAALREAQAVLS